MPPAVVFLEAGRRLRAGTGASLVGGAGAAELRKGAGALIQKAGSKCSDFEGFVWFCVFLRMDF